MRKITLGGAEYPVHASMNVKRAFDLKAQKVIDAATSDGADDITKKAASDMAMKSFLTDIETNLWLLATLINEAVDYESVMNNRDIRSSVPYYPLNERKLGMIASAADLNHETTVQAIAEEFAECLGTEKNFTAAELKQMAQSYLTMK